MMHIGRTGLVRVAGIYLNSIKVGNYAHAAQQERDCGQPAQRTQSPDRIVGNERARVRHEGASQGEAKTKFPRPMHEVQRGLPADFRPRGKNGD